MDDKQYQYMRMQQYQYVPQMPFYMSYPIQNIYMAEMEYERDMERMKELYPEEAKRIQKLVEEECDKMEYEGSMMFDEYPDRVMLRAICDRIYQNATEPREAQEAQEIEPEMEPGPEIEIEAGLGAEQVEGLNYRHRPPGPPPGRPPHHRPPHHRPPGRPPHHRPPSQDQELGNLIEVLLYNEMYKRRCRHNRCRRWW